MTKSARELYDRLFSDPQYNSEGLDAPRFQFARKHIPAYAYVLDVGAGRGRLREALGLSAFRCVPVDLQNYGGASCALLCDLGTGEGQRWLERWSKSNAVDWTACLDVLEHLPENRIIGTIGNLWNFKVPTVISVSNNEEEAHLTVKPLDWWRNRISDWFRITAEEIHNNGQTLCVAGTPL